MLQGGYVVTAEQLGFFMENPDCIQFHSVEQKFRKENFYVAPVRISTAKKLIERHHYARGASKTAVYLHGLFHQEQPYACLGVAWWLPPTRTAAEAMWDGDFRKVISLSRLVVVPGVPKNACSFLISHSADLIRLDGRYECLVTWADTRMGHTGAIYRAANWEYLGLTKPQRVYLDSEGKTVSRKMGPKTRNQTQMEELGYEMIGKFPKHKFRMIIDRKERGN